MLLETFKKPAQLFRLVLAIVLTLLFVFWGSEFGSFKIPVIVLIWAAYLWLLLSPIYHHDPNAIEYEESEGEWRE